MVKSGSRCRTKNTSTDSTHRLLGCVSDSRCQWSRTSSALCQKRDGQGCVVPNHKEVKIGTIKAYSVKQAWARRSLQKLFSSLLSHDGVEPPPSSVRAPAWESNFGLSQFEPRLWSPNFWGQNSGGSKSEKLSFHLASCNMQLLANYTKYYTVDGVSQEVLIN